MTSATREYARLSSPQPPIPCIYHFAGDSFLICMGGGARVLSYNIILWYNVARAILWIMKSDSVKLWKNMKRIRIQKGISQGDIVRSLGVSRAFISNIENGKTNPTLSTITNIAKALGISSDELLK